ncbi:MAG: hypothetical protein WCK81_15065, partial [Betaproteobacteria bacterium]
MAVPKAKQRINQLNSRSKNRWYDFHADAGALATIERLRCDNPALSVSGIVTSLVDAGFKALFPATSVCT